jgi:hypothetical protein
MLAALLWAGSGEQASRLSAKPPVTFHLPSDRFRLIAVGADRFSEWRLTAKAVIQPTQPQGVD